MTLYEGTVYWAIRDGARTLPKIMNRTGLLKTQVCALLTSLTFKGYVTPCGSAYVAEDL